MLPHIVTHSLRADLIEKRREKKLFTSKDRIVRKMLLEKKIVWRQNSQQLYGSSIFGMMNLGLKKKKKKMIFLWSELVHFKISDLKINFPNTDFKKQERNIH